MRSGRSPQAASLGCRQGARHQGRSDPRVTWAVVLLPRRGDHRWRPGPDLADRGRLARRWASDELVEHFTLLPDEVGRLRNKSGPTRLGFALLLKFFTHRVGSRLVVGSWRMRWSSSSPSRWGWRGLSSASTTGRAGRSRHTGRRSVGRSVFRGCSVADAEKLTAWLAEHVVQAERRPDQVRVELPARCWESGLSRRAGPGSSGSWPRRCTRARRRCSRG
jgi:hypothetical protein